MLYDPNRNKVMPHRSIARAHVANSVGGFRLAWQLIGSTVLWTFHICCAGGALGQTRRKDMPSSSRRDDNVCGRSLLRRSYVLSTFCWKMGDEWNRHGREATFVLIMRRGLAGSERFVMGDGRLVDFGGAGPSSAKRQAARASWLRTVCCT
jgi:hypothetical protein